MKNKQITDINKDFVQWYTDVVLKTKLADYGFTKGTMVIMPYGYDLWTQISSELDVRLKQNGAQNAYFPMFIPNSYFNKEVEHINGFNPEVAIVEYAGENKLNEKLIIRPTSEAIIAPMFAKWIKSYRDLPLIINQWCNVVRWEKNTRPFLRTSEFLWQECHTAHINQEEAQNTAINMLQMYKDFAENILALPVLTGEKTICEKFAGAISTFGMEVVLQDGKSLQIGTSHYLGQNFSKVFNICYLNNKNKLEYVHTTSCGVSTRLIGALIMAHGDQNGLVLPPLIAPVQIIIISVKNKQNIIDKCNTIYNILKTKFRVKIDVKDNSVGWKLNEYEMLGIPYCISIGDAEVNNNCVTIIRRNNLAKILIEDSNLINYIQNDINIMQKEIYDKAYNNKINKIKHANNFDEFKIYIEKQNFVIAPYCNDGVCEKQIKELTQATPRVICNDVKLNNDKCIFCNKTATCFVYFAKSY